jgi:hypothetical protein
MIRIKSVFTLILACIFLAACASAVPQVGLVEPKIIPLGVDKFEVKNCEDMGEMYTHLADEYPVEKKIVIADEAVEVSSGTTSPVPEEVKTSLAAQVDRTYQTLYEEEDQSIAGIELYTPGDTIRVFRIQIIEKKCESKVTFRMEGKTYQAGYLYTLHVPNYLGHWELTCLG